MQGVPLAADHLLSQVVKQYGPLQQSLQVPRGSPILRQELERDQHLRDVVPSGPVRIGGHVQPTGGNALDQCRLIRAVEITDAPDERVPILQLTRLDLQRQGPNVFEQVRQAVFQVRDRRFHRRITEVAFRSRESTPADADATADWLDGGAYGATHKSSA